MSDPILTQPITVEAFAPFGDLVKISTKPDKIINQGMCERYHDLAKVEFQNGRAGISLFNAVPRELPYKLDLVERHPLGSQTFIPMNAHEFLIIVATDNMGVPNEPKAFITKPYDVINFHRNTWHGVLTPLHASGIFAVVDLITEENNLEEYWFKTPLTIERS